METKQATKGVQAIALQHSAAELVLTMVNALVDDRAAVSVSSRTDEMGTHIAVRVATADLGKIIGKQGRTARFMRVILGASAMKLGTRLSLDLREAEGETADV